MRAVCQLTFRLKHTAVRKLKLRYLKVRMEFLCADGAAEYLAHGIERGLLLRKGEIRPSNYIKMMRL